VNKPDSSIFRSLPAVHVVLAHSAVRSLLEEHGRPAVVGWIRDELDRCRARLQKTVDTDDSVSDPQQMLDAVAEQLLQRAGDVAGQRFGRVINATGIILHTGLGRSPLSAAARSALCDAAGAGNVEVDLATGERRYRGYQLGPAWTTLTGCEDSLIVNNNAAATLLTLQAVCAGREVIISRGQMIEIGGSFRLPEIFELSGAKLREVGTTNRTKLSDYEAAIGPETAAIMHVHPSNYRVVGFVATPEIPELTELAHAHGLASIDDIGSGALVDVTRLGLPAEPTFMESIAADADLVLGSGDKLLGGPQAGIIIGKTDFVRTVRNHPLARAVRVGKLTLAALAATLDPYLRGTAEQDIPTLSMLAATVDDLRSRAENLKAEIAASNGMTIEIASDVSPVGGGSLPGAELATMVLEVNHSELSPDELARRLRLGSIRIFPRIQQNRVIIDLRSVLPEDDSKVALAIRLAAEQGVAS
jgi:L-seryl-tRNA(Ser) seleniumtransferase